MVMCPRSASPLSRLDVLVVDCQATAAAPRGHLLEIGWAHARTAVTHARLIALPNGEHIPPPVARITGISEHMMGDAVEAHLAWRELSAQAASLTQQLAPTVIHFARFEKGEIALSASVDASAPPPIPPGYRRPVAARREAFTLASFDHLRVLTTELKRLSACGAPVALRLGIGPALDGSRLASALWWV